MNDNRGYVPPDYLEATARLVSPIKARSYQLMDLAPGARIADFGCGIGVDVLQLARLVGSTGEVTGIDSDPAMIEQAQKYCGQQGGIAKIRFDCMTSDAIPNPDGHFDACRSERMFQHLDKPANTLAEMCRVTRRGGRVVVLDTDWGTMSVDSAYAETERLLANFKATRSLRNGFAGRGLPALFRANLMRDVVIEVLPLQSTSYDVVRYACNFSDMEQRALTTGLVTQVQLDRHNDSLREADAAGRFFGSVCMILVAGVVG